MSGTAVAAAAVGGIGLPERCCGSVAPFAVYYQSDLQMTYGWFEGKRWFVVGLACSWIWWLAW